MPTHEFKNGPDPEEKRSSCVIGESFAFFGTEQCCSGIGVLAGDPLGAGTGAPGARKMKDAPAEVVWQSLLRVLCRHHQPLPVSYRVLQLGALLVEGRGQ